MPAIIRQILSYFAVPDLRNFRTIARISLFAGAAAAVWPLMTGRTGPYYAPAVLVTLAWLAPTLLANGLSAYLVGHRFLHHRWGAPLLLVLFVGEFVLVDYVFLLERAGFSAHLCQYILLVLWVMYSEANRKLRLSPSLSEARLSALTARIRPHFLFNSLNAAISLIRLRPYDAETLLENLANLFRAQLRDASQSSTLGQEIEWAQEYIAIEQIRMGTVRLQVMWHHTAPDDAETPHLLLQPLLENAVFHGVESSLRPGCIIVATKQKGHWLYIEVENPYVPHEDQANVKPHKGNSMALKNLRERLQLLYDDDARLHCFTEEGTYHVALRIPYRRKTDTPRNPFTGH